jgi:hypothetical protein
MNTRTKNNFKFLFILFVACLLAFGGAMLLTGDDDSISDFIEGLKGDSFVDNYNGIYEYSAELNGSKTVLRGCTLYEINHYISIVNDKYYLYRDSCIGTFYFGEGKVKDLDIGINEERKSYYIKYKDNVYYKSPGVTSIKVHNNLSDYNSNIPLTHIQLLLKETQFPGSYFSFGPFKIDGLSNKSNIFISFKHKGEENSDPLAVNEEFEYQITGKDGIELYTSSFKNFDSVPSFYPYGAYLVVIEKDETEEKYANKIKIFSDTEMVYDLESKFPIVVDDVVLDYNDSIYIDFDNVNRYFRVLISDTKQMCFENGSKDEISYYEFMIDYNYSTRSFEKPEFVKKGSKSDSCIYINEIIGG